MVIKLFFFFRTLFFSTATFVLLISVSAFLKLGKFAFPVALAISAVVLFFLGRNTKTILKDIKKRTSKKVKLKDIISFLISFSITTLGILFIQHFDYTKCIATGYCWR